MRSTEPLHERLKRFRLEKGLTQKELAEPRFTAAYMSILESGRRQPSSGAVAYLAEKLGVGFQELATGRPRDLEPMLMLRLQEARKALSQGDSDRAASEAKAVRTEASEHDVVRVEARAVEVLAVIEERSGNLETALALYEEIEGLLADEPLPLRTKAIAGQSRCLQMMGDLRYAIHLLETHLVILERTDVADPSAIMRLHSSLIWPYLEAGLERRAADAAKAALHLEAAVEDPAEVASMHVNAARSLLKQGHIKDAISSLERAEELYSNLLWDGEVARAYLARGIVEADRGDLERARDLMKRSLDLLDKTSDEINRARSLNELAAVERRLGNKDVAREHLETAVSLLSDADVAELALARRELGLTYWSDEVELAEKNFREAIALYEQAERPIQKAATLLLLGNLFREGGNTTESIDIYREGLETALSAG